MCNDSVIAKMPSAPRLNFGGHTAPALPATNSDSSSTAAASTPAAPASAGTAFAVADTDAASPGQQAVFLKALRHVLANTEDVGNRFADQARAMHYGDAEQRSIRGQTTPREAMDLMDEGIEVMPLPMPAAFKETLQ